MTVFIIRCNFAMLPAYNFIALFLHRCRYYRIPCKAAGRGWPVCLSHDCSLSIKMPAANARKPIQPPRSSHCAAAVESMNQVAKERKRMQ